MLNDMDYKEKLEEAKRLYELANDDQKDVLESLFPELAESEDERIRKGIIHNLKYLANKAQGFVKDELEERIAWLEKQVPVDEEKVLIGARKDVALSIMNFFDKNTLGMCLSNMEYEDLEDAVVNSDWLKVYRYMKKKLEKQDKQKEINLVEILKHYPKETELYSPLYGKLWLAEVDEKSEIITCYKHPLEEGCTRAILPQEDTVSFYSNGATGLPDYTVSKDCMLFLYNIEKQDEQKQDPCEHCDNVMLNCQNFPCIKKRAFEQGKSILEVINEEKVEPKFKVGDWVVSPNGVYWHIDRIENNRYEVTSDTGKCADWPLDTDLYHLWTIKDAKDGDVLAAEDKNFTTPFVAIYKGLRGSLTFNSHCFIGFNGNFYEGEGGHAIEGIHPATKEQREQLEKAMADAGYTFDFKKKKLKLLITNGGDFETENCEQKPAWSEEDIMRIDNLIAIIENRGYPDYVEYLEKLKYRVQPKQEWSEEDNYNLQCMIAKVTSDIQKGNVGRNNELIDWLNSLKQRINND